MAVDKNNTEMKNYFGKEIAGMKSDQCLFMLPPIHNMV